MKEPLTISINLFPGRTQIKNKITPNIKYRDMTYYLSWDGKHNSVDTTHQPATDIYTHTDTYIYKNTKTIIYLWSGLFLLIFSSIAYLEIQRSFSQRAVANPMLLIIYILLYPICIPINVQN